MLPATPLVWKRTAAVTVRRRLGQELKGRRSKLVGRRLRRVVPSVGLSLEPGR